MGNSSILNMLGFDPAYIIAGLACLTLISFITTIICILQYKRLYRRYDLFMRGKDAESLEDIIVDQIADITELKIQDKANKDILKSLTRGVRSSYQKFGVIKYNAFTGMGGNLSFAFALLDTNNTGFILNSVHSREGCYLYIKTIEKGETDTPLGKEEKEALEQALGY